MSTPVDALIVQTVVPALETAYEMAPPLEETAPTLGVEGLAVVSRLKLVVQVITGVAAVIVNVLLTGFDWAYVLVCAAVALMVQTPALAIVI